MVTDLQGIVLDRHFIDAGIYIGSTDPCWGIACGITLDEVVVTPDNNNNFIQPNGAYASGLGRYGWIRQRNSYSSMGLAYGAYYRSKALRKFDDSIDDSDLKPCMKNILTDLKKINNGLGNTIADFSGAQWEIGFNWKVKDGELPENTAGQTSQSLSDGYAMTTFDSSQHKDATDLSIAKTLLHESVHAFLVNQSRTNRASFNKTYPQLLKDYNRLSDANAAYHEECTRSFVHDISNTIEAYGRSKDYKVPSQYYQDLAWGGLTDTDAFKKLKKKDRKRIKDVISTEFSGKDMNGKKKTQKGKKAGCK